jgi:type IV secretion system protein VirD4
MLCTEDCNIYLMIPAEYAEILAPMQRAIVGAAMLHKQRIPSAPRVLFLIDEAAQLGRFESLLRGYSYGRGMGIRMWSVWQDAGQIARNFGREALSGFLGSSQTRQFFAVRDLETAQMVSRMLGTQTLEYDAGLEQAAARRNKAHIIRELMDGADPFEAGLNYAQQDRASSNRTKQARPLLAPDEILNLPENRQVLFVSGLGLMPILAEKYPYFTCRDMAGGFMPNPYHPPTDGIRLPGFFGPKWRRVITERVPSRFSHLPQYQSGEWSYIEGHKPQL